MRADKSCEKVLSCTFKMNLRNEFEENAQASRRLQRECHRIRANDEVENRKKKILSFYCLS